MGRRSRTALDSVTQEIDWPGLNVLNADGEEPAPSVFKFNWLITPGTLLLVSGLLTMLVLRISPARALRVYGQTLNQLKWATLTVATVLALAYVMNFSAQTLTLGQWIAGAGGVLAFLSAIIGWLGVAVTGSDTSSNSLFGALQVQAANEAGLDPTLLAAANSSGGVLGKMISPQNLAIGAAAVGLAGQEGDLFRKVLGWSLVLLLAMCVLVLLQSTSDPLVDGRLAAAPEGPTVAPDDPEAQASERDLRELAAELRADRRRRVGLHAGAPAAHLRVRRAAAVPRDAGGGGAAGHRRGGAAGRARPARGPRCRGSRAAPARASRAARCRSRTAC